MPTRVLYLSETLTEGGAQRVTSTLLNRLDRSKFVPSLCLLRDRITYPLPDDVAVHVLRQGGLMTLLRSRRRLRRVIADWKPDVMLSNLAYTNLFAGEALANRPKKVRWIARVGNNPVLENTNWRGKLQHLRLSKLYPMADAIVPNSNGLAQAFRNCFPTAAHLVRVIENPTDFEYVDNMASQPPPVVADAERPVVISVGRLTRQKRPDVLLEAFAAIHKEMPSAVLWILGDGPLRNWTEEQIAQRGWGDHVRIFGFVNNPYSIMRQASVFVLTSDWEGLPNALIEAQGLGVPAVSTRCPFGPEEIIRDGITGWLVDSDASQLGQKILSVLRDRPRRMGQLARERAREMFASENIVPRWQTLLTEPG